MFATTAAPVIVEVADKFVNLYNVIALGIAEGVILMLSPRTASLAEEINKYSKKLKIPTRSFAVSVKFLGPAVLLGLCVAEGIRLISVPPEYPLWIILAFGAGISLTVVISAVTITGRRAYMR